MLKGLVTKLTDHAQKVLEQLVEFLGSDSSRAARLSAELAHVDSEFSCLRQPLMPASHF